MSKYNKTLFVNTVRRVLLFVNLTGFAMFDACILCKTTSTPSFAQSAVRDVKENREKKKQSREFTRPFYFLAVYLRSRWTN